MTTDRKQPIEDPIEQAAPIGSSIGDPIRPDPPDRVTTANRARAARTVPAGPVVVFALDLAATGGAGIYTAAGVPALLAAGGAVTVAAAVRGTIRARAAGRRRHLRAAGGRAAVPGLGRAGRRRRATQPATLGGLGRARRRTGTSARPAGLLAGGRRRTGRPTGAVPGRRLRAAGQQTAAWIARRGQAARRRWPGTVGRVLRRAAAAGWTWARQLRAEQPTPSAIADGIRGDTPPAAAPATPPAARPGVTPRPATANPGGQPAAGPITGGVMRFHELAKEAAVSMAGYEPTDMNAYRRDLEKLPEALRDIATALHRLHVGAADLPVKQSVRDALGAIVAAQAATAVVAEEVITAYRRLHAKELARYSDPRPGEHKWDISGAG